MVSKETIDYNEIDELCRNIIHTCNEYLGMTTLFCCQGVSKEDVNSHHASCPYIMFLESDKTLKILKALLRSKLSGRNAYFWKLTYTPYDYVDRWTLRYERPSRLKPSKSHLKKLWDNLESELIKLHKKIN